MRLGWASTIVALTLGCGPSPAYDVLASPPSGESAPSTPSHSSADSELAKATHDVVWAHLGQIRDCYEQLRSRRPKAKGSIWVAWQIELDGSVGSVRITDSTFDDGAIEACIRSAVSTWRYAHGFGRVVDSSWGFGMTPP